MRAIGTSCDAVRCVLVMLSRRVVAVLYWLVCGPAQGAAQVHVARPAVRVRAGALGGAAVRDDHQVGGALQGECAAPRRMPHAACCCCSGVHAAAAAAAALVFMLQWWCACMPLLRLAAAPICTMPGCGQAAAHTAWFHDCPQHMCYGMAPCCSTPSWPLVWAAQWALHSCQVRPFTGQAWARVAPAGPEGIQAAPSGTACSVQDLDRHGHK